MIDPPAQPPQKSSADQGILRVAPQGKPFLRGGQGGQRHSMLVRYYVGGVGSGVYLGFIWEGAHVGSDVGLDVDLVDKPKPSVGAKNHPGWSRWTFASPHLPHFLPLSTTLTHFLPLSTTGRANRSEKLCPARIFPCSLQPAGFPPGFPPGPPGFLPRTPPGLLGYICFPGRPPPIIVLYVSIQGIQETSMGVL